ncbi:MAG: hypothetical protein ABIR08_04430 [Sphingomonas sp.]
MTDPLARFMVALDPGRVVRPGATPDYDQPDIFHNWLAHLEAGRLGRAARAPADSDTAIDPQP